MSRAFDEALANARQRRRALLSTLGAMRTRFSPPQLAEDTLSLIDPELTLLHRARARILNNRLLSLAVLAGVGWLVGAPRHNDGEPFGAGNAGTSQPRSNTKEKKNDSGQVHGEHWPRAGAGHQEKRRSEELAEEIHAWRRRQAQQGGGVPPDRGKPRQQDGGRQGAEQPDEKQPQRQPEVRQRL